MADQNEVQPPKARTPLKILAKALSVLITAGLILYVVKSVAWTDTLTIGIHQDIQPEVFEGEIIGSWRSEVVQFRAEPGAIPGPAIEATWAGARLGEGAVLGVNRGAGLLSFEGETLEATLEAKPGMPTVFQDLELAAMWPALATLFAASLFIVTRWWRLLLLAGCPTRWLEALRLTYVGLFFNTVLPGSTGGDLVRAYVVVRGHPERRANALTSVLADRAIGLLGMVLLSSAAILTVSWAPTTLRVLVLLALAALVGGCLTVINPWIRRVLRFDQFLTKLPQGERLLKFDQAVRSYASHPRALIGALLLSMGNHLCSTACCYFIGHALGDTHGFHDYLCIVTVANTVSALPLSPGGIGVGEHAFGTLLALANGLYMIGVATSIVYRISLAFLGLGGGLALLLPGGSQVLSEYGSARDASQARNKPPLSTSTNKTP